jgi:uncharacterized protein
MINNILDEARAFLANSLKGRPDDTESKHSWNKSWEYYVLHSLRVESYILKILARENQPLSDHEIILLRLAAILHDISKIEPGENHAGTGAEMANKWLRGHSTSPLDDSDIGRVVEMIADHSNKNVHEQNFNRAVLKDADSLDQIGAMSILMASNWVEPQSPFFFYALRQRLIEFELPFCDRELFILNTNGAKEILREKKTFVENFIAQLTDELEADGQIEQRLLGAFKRD